MDVWVIESGEYEQRGVNGVAASVETAAKFIRAGYGEPYVVKWDAPIQCGDEWELHGHFSAVLGYSSDHEAIYTFTKYTLAD